MGVYSPALLPLSHSISISRTRRYFHCFHEVIICCGTKEKKRQFTRQETPTQKQARISSASSRKLRQLSGWNVYQRESLKGLQLEPGEYHQKVKEISGKWRSLSQEDREAYQVEAAHQQAMRDKLSELPLASKSEREGGDDSDMLKQQADLEQKVGRSGCKKLSARRLALNMESHTKHSLWNSSTNFADSNWPFEKQCYIFLSSPFRTIAHGLLQTMRVT